MASLYCAMCDDSGAKRCDACHSISYCSTECQKEDWALHKTICSSISAVPPRPSPAHKLAILFPVVSKKPELIYIHCELHVEPEDEGGDVWEYPGDAPILASEDVSPEFKNCRSERKPITRNVLRDFRLDHTVVVSCRDTFMMDGSKTNACVARTTNSTMAHGWKGPIVVMRQPGTAMDPLIYEDVRAEDLRVAVDYFVSYGRD